MTYTGSRITIINAAYGPDPVTGKVIERTIKPGFFRFGPDDRTLPAYVVADADVVHTEVTS